jgi:type IX secretion system PorP/SprF family membrane protein
MFLLMVFGVSRQAFAQQDPIYTQYMSNILLVNPAYASVGTALEVNAISRNQWVGIEGAPVTNSLSVMLPLKNLYTGLGAIFISDEIGPIKQTGAYFDYAFKIRLSYRSYLSFGLKAGVNFFNTDYGYLSVNDQEDPILIEDVTRKFLPNFGLGFFLYNNRFFGGISVPKLIRNQINSDGYSSQYASKEEIHLFVITGYVFDISDDVKFKPYALAKMVPNTPISVDLSAHFMFYDRLWVGANWRLGDSVGAMAQVFASKRFKVGYAYDVTVSGLGSFNNGTHEFLLSYIIDLGRRKYISPRYF